MIEKQISLTIESRLENVSQVGVAVNNYCAQLPLNPEEANKVELCVNEAVVNSIKHAYQNAPNQFVEIVISTDDDWLIIQVSDTGKSMNPDRLSSTSTQFAEYSIEDLDAVPSTGRGLMIIKSYMDSVSYKIEAFRNTLTMTKKIIISKDTSL